MARRIRTFVAVEVPANVRAKIAQLMARLRVSPANVKWVDDLQLHYTLKFLGNLTIQDVGEVCAAVQSAVEELPAFEIQVGGLGAFPTPDRPRTVWVGVRQGEAEMVALHNAIERQLSDLGFRTENRRFRPHLTIGRVRNSPEGIPELAAMMVAEQSFLAGVVSVDEAVVFSSELGPKGPTYDVLGTAELAG